MERKYYVPEIDEFCVGFEYETLEAIRDGSGNKSWNKWTQGNPPYRHKEIMDRYFLGQLEGIRVKYLDKEDIESLGWEYDSRTVCRWFKKEGYFEDGYASYGYWTKLRLIHCEDTKSLRIMAYEFSWEEDGITLFQGKIKNKTELRKLMKQLNID